MGIFKDRSASPAEIKVSEGGGVASSVSSHVAAGKPDLVIDINQGIVDLLATRKAGSVEELGRVMRECCLQACDCCLQAS